MAALLRITIERVVVSRSDLQGACTRTIAGKHTRFSTSPPELSLHMTRRGVKDGALPPDQRLLWERKHQGSWHLKKTEYHYKIIETDPSAPWR